LLNKPKNRRRHNSKQITWVGAACGNVDIVHTVSIDVLINKTV